MKFFQNSIARRRPTGLHSLSLSLFHVAHLNLSILIRLTKGSNSPGMAPYNRLLTHRFKRNRFVHLTISCVSLSHSRNMHTHLSLTILITMMSYEQAIARQAELSIIISRAATNLKNVGVANLSHTIIITRINAHEKNWS